jgi:hypothetical protein
MRSIVSGLWKNVTSVAELNVHSGSNGQMVDLSRLILCDACLFELCQAEGGVLTDIESGAATIGRM